MKKLFAKNKVLFSLAIVVIVCVVLIFIKMISYFYGDGKKDKYGSRLNGIENYVIPSDLEEKITNLYTENKYVKSVDVSSYGKIIYITEVYSAEINVDKAKEESIKCLDVMNEELLSYYDIQLILKSENEEAKGFPMMGYKNSSNEEFVWTINSIEGDNDEE